MNTNSIRFKALVKLGLHLKKFNILDSKYLDLKNCIQKAIDHNPWFTKENILYVFENWAFNLEEKNIEKWLNSYNLNIKKPKTIALVLAGNIPMVGFHDLICVWLSGHRALIKCASKDELLLPYMTAFLEKESKLSSFTYTNRPLAKFDAVIATGSNNSANYFEYYFGNYPNIIRKNRNGIAVLNGEETLDELEGLGKDILQFYGLGCRNVSKLYLPKNYDLNLIFGGLYTYSHVIDHPKYANNYDYNKALYLMSECQFLENGFFMLKEDPAFSAPIACLHYEYYNNIEELKKHLKENKESLQCIISNIDIENALCFGKAQQPTISEYADEIDTLSFLSNL